MLSKAYFGIYSLQVYVQVSSMLELILAALAISVPMRRRRHFGLLLPLGLALCFGVAFLCAVIRTHEWPMDRIVTLVLHYAAILMLMWLCWDEEIYLILKSWCAGIAMAEIVNSLFILALAAAGRSVVTGITFFPEWSPERDWAIYFAFRIVGYTAIVWPMRSISREPADRIARRNMTLLTLFSLTALSVLISLTNIYREESIPLYLIIRVFIIILGGFILLLRFGITLQSQARNELTLMEAIVREQRKQYELNRENVNAVNMLCHDLKHRLDSISGKLTDEEIRSLREAMEIYDNTIRTGNEVLDVVLYEYQLICQRENIRLSCMADGRLIAFMRSRHIYALFSNILRNALEAVRKLKDPEKKNIGITLEKRNGKACISAINYFSGVLSTDNGQILTSKEDRNRHGLGLQSVRYILNEYDGTLTASVGGEVFTLNAEIPIPERK